MSSIPQPGDSEDVADIEHPAWCNPFTCSISAREVNHRSAGELFEPSDDAELALAIELNRWRVDTLDEHGQQRPGPEAVELTRAWTGEQITTVSADDAPRFAAMLLSRTRTDA